MAIVPDDANAAMKYQKLPFIFGKFFGVSAKPSYEVEIETIYLSRFKLNSGAGKPPIALSFQIFSPIKVSVSPMQSTDNVEFRRGISNLQFWGIQMVQRGSHMTLSSISWQLDGKNTTLEQLPSYTDILEHLKEFKDVAVTSELRMKENYSQLAVFREIADNLQNLFSLASANYNTAIYEDIYLGGQLSASMLFPLKTYIYSDRPQLIDCSIGQELKDFIDTTYRPYVTYKKNLGLSYFIEFLTTSKMYSPLEVEYVLQTTAFECLENYFKNWRRLPEIKNDLKKKIVRMFDYFGFAITPKELEDYRLCRNSVSHEGKFPIGYSGAMSTMQLRNIIDQFILTILNYINKPYYNSATRSKDIVPLPFVL